jgi:hypothetical protein
MPDADSQNGDNADDFNEWNRSLLEANQSALEFLPDQISINPGWEQARKLNGKYQAGSKHRS